jgi:hypothetical protein
VGDHVQHRWCEECIQVNYDLRYVWWSVLITFYLIIASKGRSQGRMKWIRHKSYCIHQDQESMPAYEDKKWLSRRINLHRSQRWCRSGPPKIATPAKSVDPEKREEV